VNPISGGVLPAHPWLRQWLPVRKHSRNMYSHMLYNMLLNMLLVRQNYKALSSVARDHACHAHYLSTCGMSHPALLLIAAVLTATGRIAAATYRITLTHNGYYLYFTMRREMPSPPKKLRLPWEYSGSNLIHGRFLGPSRVHIQAAPPSIGSAVL